MSTQKISRRTWLKGLALVSAAAGVPSLVASTAAEAKASKAAVHYRDYPKGMQMCHMCKYYIGSRSGMMGRGMMGHGMMGGGMMGGGMMGRGGMMRVGACQVVQGRISPMGWCDLYAPV